MLKTSPKPNALWCPLGVAAIAGALVSAGCVQIKAISKRGSSALEDACATSTGAPPVLATKQISGRPGATVNLSISGDVAKLKLRFRDANGRAFDQFPSASGNILLPAQAGLYQVELLDRCSDVASYGLATVNDAYTSFAASATVTSFSAGYFRNWPDVSHTLGDLDEDGDLEYIFASGHTSAGGTLNPGIHIFNLNPVTNAYVFSQMIPNTSGAYGVKAGDFNGDRHLDIIWASQGNKKIRISLGDGDGGFATPDDLDLPVASAAGLFYGYDVELADLDRDGDLDFVVGGGLLDGGVTWTVGIVAWFLNRGDGSFIAHQLEGMPGYPVQSIQIADADDDGRLDIFAYGQNPTPRLFRFLQQSNGGYSNALLGTDYLTTLPIVGSQPYEALRVGYLNSDNRPDAVSLRVNGPSTVFLSNSTDLTLAAGTIPTFTDQHGARATIADLDTDGENELYMPLKNRALFANKAGIMRKLASSLTAAASPNAGNTILGSPNVFGWAISSLTVGDIDRDGKIDFVMPVADLSHFQVILAQ